MASPGEVLVDTYGSAPNINGQSFTTMGNISLSEGTLLDVSSDAAGAVIIRGGQLMMTNATISADTVNQNGPATAVDIQVSGDIAITATQAIPAIAARTTGEGNAGGVRIATGNNMDVTANNVHDDFSLIDTHTSGLGIGGHVNINVSGNLNVTGTSGAETFFIDSGTQGFEENQGGDIMIKAGNIQINNADIATGDYFQRVFLGDDGSLGSGGNMTIMANASAPNINGKSFTTMGNIALSEGTTLDVSADAAGTVIIRGGQLMMTNATISANTVNQNGAESAVDIQVYGDIAIKATQPIPAITAVTTGDGNAGEVGIMADNNMNVTADEVTESFALIDTHTSGAGTGGSVNIDVSGNLDVTGPQAPSMFLIHSGIEGEGIQGGDISISGGNIQLREATIGSGDLFSRIILRVDVLGSGGNVSIVSDDVLQMTGAFISSDATFGKAGDQTVLARDVLGTTGGFSLLEEAGGEKLPSRLKNCLWIISQLT